MVCKAISKEKSIKNAKSTFISYTFVLPFFILFLVFTVLPVAISLVLSLTSFNILETPVFVGFSNYTRLLFHDRTFLIAIKNTALIAIMTGPGGYILCLLFAWLINELPPKAV